MSFPEYCLMELMITRLSLLKPTTRKNLRGGNGVLNYHYLFEIAAAPHTNGGFQYGSQLTFIGAVNNAPSVEDGRLSLDLKW